MRLMTESTTGMPGIGWLVGSCIGGRKGEGKNAKRSGPVRHNHIMKPGRNPTLLVVEVLLDGARKVEAARVDAHDARAVGLQLGDEGGVVALVLLG